MFISEAGKGSPLYDVRRTLRKFDDALEDCGCMLAYAGTADSLQFVKDELQNCKSLGDSFTYMYFF